MRTLLDVNVLIALFDENHLFNNLAHEWLQANSSEGIASCALTENGLIRILSHPAYSKKIRLTPGEVIRRLEGFKQAHIHEFWPDDLSLCDSSVFRRSHILGSKQLTDIYLLGLAVRHQGRLLTFDAKLGLEAVVGAEPKHLEPLGAF